MLNIKVKQWIMRMRRYSTLNNGVAEETIFNIKQFSGKGDDFQQYFHSLLLLLDIIAHRTAIYVTEEACHTKPQNACSYDDTSPTLLVCSG